MDYVFVHGWCFDHRVWQETIAALTAQASASGQAIHCHALHLPGYGPRQEEAAPAQVAELAADLGRQLSTFAGPITLIGWSLGALAALAYGAGQPMTQLEQLVLVSGTASFIRRPHWPHGLPPEQLAAFQQQLATDAAALPARFALLANQGDAAARGLSRRLRECLLPADSPHSAATLAAGLHCLGEADLTAQLDQVRLPTLLLHGELDPLMPLAAAQALASALPQAELRTFPGRAHAPFLAEPERFAQHLLSPQPNSAESVPA